MFVQISYQFRYNFVPRAMISSNLFKKVWPQAHGLWVAHGPGARATAHGPATLDIGPMGSWARRPILVFHSMDPQPMGLGPHFLE